MDEIQRKLALIDKQLTGGVANFHKQIISTAPLLFVAIGLILGILLQNVFDLSILLWLILLILFSAASILFFAIRQPSSTSYHLPVTNYQYGTAYLALVCFVCLGAIWLSSFYQPESNDIRNFVVSKKELTADSAENAEKKSKMDSRLRGNDKHEERKLATIRGSIVTEPYINKNRDWEFAKFTYTDPASSFYLKLGEVETVDGWVKTAGTVRVQVDEPVLDLKAGDYIQAYCWLDRFKKATNPGQFDVAKYLARKNIFIAASVSSRDGIEILRFAQNDRWSRIFTKIKRRLRETATQALLGDLSLE